MAPDWQAMPIGPLTGQPVSIEVEKVAEREGDAKLLNGPKLDGEDVGHASQDDIDALFG